MKVSELIAELQKFPQDLKVVLASDPEGNGFHEAYELGFGRYDDQEHEYTSWMYDEDDRGYQIDASEREMTLEESNAICIWP